MYKIEDLLRKYSLGECNAQEKELLEQWYQSFEWNDKSGLMNENNINKVKKDVWSSIQKRKMTSIPENISPRYPKAVSLLKWWYFVSAAALMAAVAAISFFLQKPLNDVNTAHHVEAKQPEIKDIRAGISKAHLVLASGIVVSLDSNRNMQLKEEDGTNIDKQSGRLVYKDDENGNGKILFNTLSTPRGGEYQLVLPDGSKVWLNAASSIKYPTRFRGKERTVYLHGEAYFEVAKNKEMPFNVNLDNDIIVEVTGTHFNIMGYSDETEIKTTLEEGSVKVTHKNNSVLLSPSKQAVMKRENESLTVADADIYKALAWKKGMIEFEGDDLPYIMRQLSRWYDVDIGFKNGIPKGTYKGAIRRQAPLSDVLEILKLAGVKFKMEDKKLMVTGG